jgi:predicted RNase H-like HicB family nuclease
VRYLVRIYEHKGDYSALVPDLPGCVAAGDSVEEARTLIAKAIRLHLDALRKARMRIPKPASRYTIDADDLEDAEFCTWVEVRKKNQPA